MKIKNTIRIKEIEISSFRGIPDRLNVVFPIKNDRPTSLIILGDNGVGKSSIVDAIEFCLQGHVSQTINSDITNYPSIESFYSSQFPGIKVTLSDGEVINRIAIKDEEEGMLLNFKGPHKLFSVSPFVLRRHDILRFINSSEAERALVFSNYLREVNNMEWTEHPVDELRACWGIMFGCKPRSVAT